MRALGGRVDILINNAGGSRPIQGEETDAMWSEAYNLNFVSARKLTAMIVPAMKDAGLGRIVNHDRRDDRPEAQRGRSRQSRARHLVAHAGLRARAVRHHGQHHRAGPHQLGADPDASLHPTEQSRIDYIRQNIPAGYFGEPEDIGNLVAFLVSPLARYISGAAIPVDGGAVRMAL